MVFPLKILDSGFSLTLLYSLDNLIGNFLQALSFL